MSKTSGSYVLGCAYGNNPGKNRNKKHGNSPNWPGFKGDRGWDSEEALKFQNNNFHTSFG